MPEQPILNRDGDVFVLHLGEGEQRMHPDWIKAVLDALTEVEQTPAPRALVTTATGKIYSNGLDLEYLAANTDQLKPYVAQIHEMFARFLEASVPTVAALNGHTFAAGAMLAAAHDFRVIRADRGYWCVPEADIRIPFTPGMAALLMARIPKLTHHEAMTTGRRYGGEEAVVHGLVHEAAEETKVLHAALERVRPLADKDPGTLQAIKRVMYGDVLATLRSEQKFAVPGI
jgi:enoyl-CoA hydratase/carnithine racemase